MTAREVHSFGPYELDAAARRLRCRGLSVPLSPKAYEVLQLFVLNAGRALSREEILRAVWADTFVEPGSLDWHVSTLRKALSEAPGAIETLRGFGYRFAPEVGIAEPWTSAGEEDVETGPRAAPAPPPDSPDEPRALAPAPARRRRSVVLAAAAGAAVLALAVLAISFRARAPRSSSPTIAVLTFENLSGEPEAGWLSVALRELIAAEISQSANVTMVPGETTTQAMKDYGVKAGALSAGKLARFRQSLGTDVVVSGSYVVAGKDRKLRVVSTAQDCVSGRTLATIEQTGTVDDVLAVISQAGARLRSPFEPRSSSDGGREGAAAYGTNAETLRLYMEGLGRLRELKTMEARDLLLRATTLDPEFALAHSALADAWFELGFEKNALQEAELAQKRSGTLSREDRLLVEGRFDELAGRWDRAIDVYQALVTLSPESLDHGLKLANALMRGKRARQALHLLDQLARMRAPKGGDPRIDIARAWAARWLGDFTGMDAAGREVERKGRERALPQVIAQGLFLRSWVAVTVSRGEEAASLSAEGAALARATGNAGLAAQHLALRGYGLFALGRLEEARAAFEDGLSVARSIGYTQSVRGILSGLSQLDLSQGNIPQAEREAREAIEVSRATGDETEVTALLDLSRVEREKGDVAVAKSLALEALAKGRQVAAPSRIGNAQFDVGSALFLAGDLAGARAAFSETLEVRSATPGIWTAEVRTRLARIAVEEGLEGEAVEAARRGVAEAQPAGVVAAEAHAALAEAIAAGGAKDVEKVEKEVAAAAELVDRFGGLYERMDVALSRGRALERIGSVAEARRAFSTASEIASTHGFAADAMEAHLRLARLDASRGVPGAAERAAALRSQARSLGYGLLARLEPAPQ